MGLFDKKFCDICGSKIGMLGNRKLEDGNLCKDCAAKLSPWFSERRVSTVDSIKEQLDYREENRANLADFNTTRSLGGNTKLLLDEDHQKFVVTSARDLRAANPDIIDYSQVTGASLDVQDSKTELKRKDKEGKMVSYVPPRYEYRFKFYVVIDVNHPYFNQIRFPIKPTDIVCQQATTTTRLPGQAVGTTKMLDKPALNDEYRDAEKQGKEIVRLLTQMRTDTRKEAVAAAQPKKAVVCPYCGATTMPDANGCCEYCGSSIA